MSPSGADENFFRTLKIRTQQEINDIRARLKKLIKIESYKPTALNIDDQPLVDSLVRIRKLNQFTLDKLKCILLKDEYIICPHCNGLMYKKPLDVSFKKIGNNIILTEKHKYTNIEYIYSCPNCVFFIRECDYLNEIRYKELRESLITSGEVFVPNKFGTYYYIK